MKTKNIFSIIKSKSRRKKDIAKSFGTSSYITTKMGFPQFNLIEQILWITLGSLIAAIGFKYFLSEAKVISGGITGIALVVGNISGNINDFAIWNVLLNVPLFLFGIIFVGKRFSFFSVWAIVISSVFSVITPSAKEINLITDPEGTDRLITIITGTMLVGLAFAAMYRFGSSSGGTDFISTYLSIRKNVSITNYTLIFSLITVFVGSIVMEFSSGNRGINAYFSDTLIYTIIGLYVTKITTDFFFPKFKKCRFDIITKKGKYVRDIIELMDFPHGYSYAKIVGTRPSVSRESMIIVCSYMERQATLDMLHEADPDAFITIQRLTGFSGKFKTPIV